MMEIKELQKQLNELETEIKLLEKDSANPDIIRNASKIKEISKDLNEKKEKQERIKKLLSVEKQIADNKQIIEEETDQELVNLANEENESLEKSKKTLEDELSGKSNSSQDIKQCIIEIRAGTGGEEANLFAADLFRMYSKYSEKRGWQVQILSKNQTGTGGFKEVIAQVNGEGSFDALQYESGVHRVQRVPVTESSGRIHTSAASVVVFPLVSEKEITIDPQELKIDVYRSGGPGGQSVNTTDSAVRITHIPTGMVVTCQDEKSQHKNKKKALSILASRLQSFEQEKQEEELSQVRKSAIKTGDRSAKIRTYNFPQSRITDHRIKKSWHNLKGVLDGDLDQIIDTLKNKL